MRILFLSRNSSTDGSAYTHRLRMLARGLTSFGIECDFFYMGDFSRTSHTMIPLYISMLRRLFRSYDAIHAGSTPCAYSANLCKPFQARVIYDIHGDRIAEIVADKQNGSDNSRTGFMPVVKAVVQEMGATWFSDHYLAVSEPLKKLAISRGAEKNRVSLIRNGVDLKLFSPKKSSRVRPVIAYAGQFQSYQAVGDLLNAAVSFKNAKMEFHFIGFTPADLSLKGRLQSSLGNRVRLIDRVDQVSLVRHLQNTDVLVIPRRYSKVTSVAFPTKFAEYIALGKPVIVSDVDETAEFVRKSECGLVYTNGASGIVNALNALMDMRETERVAMGNRGRELARKEFNWDAIAARYLQILKSMISSCGPICK